MQSNNAPVMDEPVRIVEPADHLRALIEEDPAAIDAYLSSLSGNDVLRAMFRLNPDERRTVLLTLEAPTAAEFIGDVPDGVAADLIEELPAESAASIITALPSDNQADVLGEMEDEELEVVMRALAPHVATKARELIRYPAESAGGLMVREYLAFGPRDQAGDVLAEITSPSRDLSRYILRYAYIVDVSGQLRGVVRTSSLVGIAPTTRLADLMTTPIVVNAESDLATCNAALNEAELLSLAVVDDQGRMLGILSRPHVDEALADRAQDDHLKSQGILEEELRSMPFVKRTSRRLSWLSINIVLNIIAASVIAAFEETLAAVIALAVFLPIVSDMSGCSGNQAVAVSMRELTLGVVSARDVLRVWWQEVRVGLVNGLVLGCLLGFAAWLWKGNAALSLVVAAALGLNTVIAVSIGGTVPLLLKRIGIDPAVASGPLLTTVTDLCGFFLVLGLATVALGAIGT